MGGASCNGILEVGDLSLEHLGDLLGHQVRGLELMVLSWEDPLEESMVTHSSILAWRIPMDRGAWWATVHGVAKSWT